MKVLLSIKPEYAKKIFNGTKKYEYRKRYFNNPKIKTVVVYATKPIGKIIGEFDIESFMVDTPEKIWEKTKKFSGINKQDYQKYYFSHSQAIAVKIKSFIEYETPICPYEKLPNFYPPQSFMYIKHNGLETI